MFMKGFAVCVLINSILVALTVCVFWFGRCGTLSDTYIVLVLFACMFICIVGWTIICIDLCCFVCVFLHRSCLT